jgi:hypothetical protein
MNAYLKNAHVNALSDNDLDAVSGGDDKVTAEDVKKALAPGKGLCPSLTPAAIAEALKYVK